MEAKARAKPSDSCWVTMLLKLLFGIVPIFTASRDGPIKMSPRVTQLCCVLTVFSSTRLLTVLPKDGQCLKTGT